MKNFNRGGGFGAKKSGGGSFGHRDSRDSGGRGFNRGGGDSYSKPEMHRATCAECGQSCEVPFRPSGDKPVYCSNCFKGKDAANSNRSGGRDFQRGGNSFGRPERSEMFKATCAECGQSCEVPFRPSGDKPVYCSNCFSNRGENAGNSHSHSHASVNATGNSGISKEQFESLNAKLDKILRALNPASPVFATEKAVKAEPALKIDIVKEVKKPEVKKIDKKSVKKAVVMKVPAPKLAVIKKAKKK